MQSKENKETMTTLLKPSQSQKLLKKCQAYQK